MLVLLTDVLPDQIELAELGDNVAYRPDLADGAPAALVAAVVSLRPDALVTRAAVDDTVLEAWRTARPGVPLVAVAAAAGDRERCQGSALHLTETDPEQGPLCTTFWRSSGPVFVVSGFAEQRMICQH